MERLSSDERLDFMRRRSPLYIYQLSFGCLWEFSNLVGNNQRVPLMGDHVIVDLITKCPHSYGLIKGGKFKPGCDRSIYKLAKFLTKINNNLAVLDLFKNFIHAYLLQTKEVT